MRDRENIDALLFSMSEEDGSHAFRIFYDLYYRNVFRFCYYILHDRDATTEVVSDVFVAVWRSRKRLREISDIEAYLHTVSRNESLRFIRRKRRRTAAFPLEKFPPPHRSEDTADESQSPEAMLDSKQLEELIHNVVDELPEKCRTIFLMSRAESMSTRAIAETLAISESTVRVQIKIAIDRIGRALARLYPDMKLITFFILLFAVHRT